MTIREVIEELERQAEVLGGITQTNVTGVWRICTEKKWAVEIWIKNDGVVIP